MGNLCFGKCGVLHCSLWAVQTMGMGNLCFGKCGVLHCSLWAVQTIYFLYTQHGIFKSTIEAMAFV